MSWFVATAVFGLLKFAVEPGAVTLLVAVAAPIASLFWSARVRHRANGEGLTASCSPGQASDWRPPGTAAILAAAGASPLLSVLQRVPAHGALTS